MMSNKGIAMDTWWRPTLIVNLLLYFLFFVTVEQAPVYIVWTSLISFSSMPRFYIAHCKTFYWTLSNPFSKSTKAEYRGSVLEGAFQISDVVKNYFILTSLSGLPLIVFSSYYQKTNIFERKIQQSQ